MGRNFKSLANSKLMLGFLLLRGRGPFMFTEDRKSKDGNSLTKRGYPITKKV